MGTRLRIAIMLLTTFAVASCSQPSSKQPPAPSGVEFWVEQVTDRLSYPWEMAWLPDGDMLITERTGKLRRVHEGIIDPEPIAGTPQVLTASMFDGLLDVKLDPDFAQNHFIYLTFTRGGDTMRIGSILKARLDGNRLVDRKLIFSTKVPVPTGGPSIMRILFLPDKTMLIGIGSGGQGSRGMVQRLNNYSGKIIHLDLEGVPVPGGPFSGTEGALPEIWAIGLRNPSGLVRTVDGSIWGIDIGPKGGDELNLLKPGANYGWPLVSWGFDYSGNPMSDIQEGPDFTAPAAVWSPSIAPSGLVQLNGDRYPFWRGDLFTGLLAGHAIRRIRVTGGKVVQQEDLLGDWNERIRTVRVGPDGLLYVLTDSPNGRLLRLRPGRPASGDRQRMAKPNTLPAGMGLKEDFARRGVYQDRTAKAVLDFKYDKAAAERLFGQHCASCHTAGQFTTGEIGPTLNGVVGRQSGKLPGYDFSEALRGEQTSVRWDRDSIVAFIANPQAYYPGTKMTAPPVTDFKNALQIGAFLEETSR